MSVPYAEVIGDPISHSKSPLVHKFWLEKLGIDADYRPVRVPPGGLADYFASRRGDADWRGCNVTVPHKQSVRDHVDRIDDVAAAIGAINTVRSFGNDIGGTNTDCDGFIEPLRAFDLEGRRAAIIGAGGAARAVVLALTCMRLEIVAVVNRSRANAAEMMLSFGGSRSFELLDLSDPIPPVDLLINTTSLGMAGQPALDLDLSRISEGCIVYDIVYSPLETELLAAARKRGLRTIDGLQMLVGQAALAFEIFFGAAPPRQHDAELRELLIR